MKNFSSFAFFFCLFLLAKADLNDVKNNALKKIDAQVVEIQKLADQTSIAVQEREGNVKFITKHAREFGDGVIGKVSFEVTNTAKFAYMRANLQGNTNDVYRCIESREREALDDSDKTYRQKFLDPGRDYETKAEEYQRNQIKAWKDDYYKSIDQYASIYKRTIDDIKRASSEAAVSNAVKNFNDITNQMANIITNILPALSRTHLQVLNIFVQLTQVVQQYAAYRIPETTKAIDKCFPRSLNFQNLPSDIFAF